MQAPAAFAAAGALARRLVGYALPLREARVPIALLRGPTRVSGRPGTLLVAGTERWVRYFPGRFFAGTPERNVVAHAPAWTLARKLREMRGTADVTMVRVDALSARLWFDEDYLTVPEWIGSRIPIPFDLAALARKRRSVAEDLRRTRLGGYTSEVSHDSGDFRHFYERMFVPYIRARYGDDAYVPPERVLRRDFRQGGLLWLVRDGKRVGGQLYALREGVLVLRAVAAQDLDVGLRRHGAMAALYVHTLRFAHERGCSEVDLRGTRPSITDGLFVFKRKWGAVLYDRPDNPYTMLLHWNRIDGAAREFLAAAAPIFRVDGALHGIAVVERAAPWTQDALREACDDLRAPGLRRIVLVADPAIPPGLPRPDANLALDLAAVRDGGPRAVVAALRGSD